jgi:hypothetical protein
MTIVFWDITPNKDAKMTVVFWDITPNKDAKMTVVFWDITPNKDAKMIIVFGMPCSAAQEFTDVSEESAGSVFKVEY